MLMKSKKISFIANSPLSSNKISIYQTLCQAQSIGKLISLDLIIPQRSDYDHRDGELKKIKKILNIEEELSFKVDNLKYIDFYYLKIPKRIKFSISSFFFSLKAINKALKNNSDLIYTRDIITLLMIYLFKKFNYIKQKVIFESHQYSPIRSKLMNCADILLVLNKYQLKKYNHKNAFVVHDAIWEKDIYYSTKDIVNKSIFYCGSCGPDKGIDRLITLAKLLPDYQFMVATLENYKNNNVKKEWKINNINWLGKLNREELFKKINSAEFCILPNDLKNSSNKYSSPMKLFEYMSKGKALILSCIPTVIELLKKDEYIELPSKISESNIKNIIQKSNSSILGKKSLNSIKNFTWENRAMTFIKLIEKL